MDCIPSTSVGFFAIPMQENLTQPVTSSETVLFSISYSDLIKFHYFADTTERGVWALKETQRQCEFLENSNKTPK
jgi:hypothetical protein